MRRLVFIAAAALALAGCAQWPRWSGERPIPDPGNLPETLMQAAAQLSDAPPGTRLDACRQARERLQTRTGAVDRLWFGVTLSLSEGCAPLEEGMAALAPVSVDADPAWAALARYQSAVLEGHRQNRQSLETQRQRNAELDAALQAEQRRAADLEEKLRALTAIEQKLNQRKEPESHER